VLARVLEVIAPATANARLRAYLDAAVARGEYQVASAAATQLVNQYVSSGRLAEALTLTGQAIGYTRQADAGPWTQLLVEVQRLGVLNAMGQAKRVPGEVKRLRHRMRALHATSGPDENVAAWHVREKLLDTDRDAARQLGRWRTALGLNAEVIDSMRDRRALATEIARARFNDYGPLLMLGRADDALELLLDCRQVFQDARDYGTLGRTLTALAHTEDARGHGDATTRLERDALRYKYLAGDVIGIAASYHNLGTYLHRHDRQPALALACHLASALISAFASIEDNGDSVDSAAADLYEFDTAAIPPTDLADLERQVGDIPGTDLTRLIDEISPGSETAERTLQGLIAQAEAQALAARRSATASAKWRRWPWRGGRSRSA
jgi:tetratricopeptide (TPR) repeat protein